MQNLTTKTVREIALEMPITTRVFEEFKIDYCCGGRLHQHIHLENNLLFPKAIELEEKCFN